MSTMEDVMLHYAFRAKFPSRQGMVYAIAETHESFLIVAAQPVGVMFDEKKVYEVGYRFDGDVYSFDELDDWKESTVISDPPAETSQSSVISQENS